MRWARVKTRSKNSSKPGQAMVESLLAIIIITFLFLALFKVAHLMLAKVLVEHAAMRVARARAVGLNKCMCLKDARIAVMSLSNEDDKISNEQAVARIPIYMVSENMSRAAGILDFEIWDHLSLDIGDGTDSKVKLANDWFTVDGRAGIERNADYYMNDEGL